MFQTAGRFLSLSTLLILGVLPLPNAHAQSLTSETVFVSTFNGHQILAVNSVTGATTVIYTGDSNFIPEGIVIGPDNKIYAFSSESNPSRIWRMNRDGSQAEIIYEQSTTLGCTNTTGGAATCPVGPEGPSVSTSGDLFFNTRDLSPSGVWKLAGIFSVPFGGPFPAPHQVLTNAAVPTGTGSSYGEGTRFDSTEALLVVDRTGSTVVRSASPFTATSTFISATDPGTGTPVGIGVNSAGDVFVANEGAQNINRFSSTGGFLSTYFTFSSLDRPFYQQFDAANTLFAVSNDGSGNGGKVWRIDPSESPSSGTGTLLIDLQTTFNACDGTCSLTSPVPGLASGQAVGLALPATTFTTGLKPIAPGTTTTFTDGTIITQTLQLPADVNMGGAAFMAVSFMQIAPAVFNTTRIPAEGATTPNAWSGGTSVPAGTTLTPIAGTGGNGIVAEKLCFDINQVPIIPCNIIAPTTLIQLTSRYHTQAPQPIPALIIATDGQNDWANITDFFSADPIGGGSKGLNTDEAIVNLPFSPYSATIQQPINSDGSSVFGAKRGVIPVKFTLALNGAATCALPAATIALTRTAGGTPGPIDESVYLGSADSGSNFRISSCQYIYNLASSPLGVGTYRVDIIINGAVVGTGVFALK